MVGGSGQSWGRYPKVHQRIIAMHDRNQPIPDVASSILPHGNGRSYGDSCLNTGATLLITRGLDRFIAFDPEHGILRCEAGVLLSDILEFCVPKGWFLPVTPGTKFVTVGGAIANDVHGKNHHVAGTFGCHIRAFELLRSDGSRIYCAPLEQSDWFAATIGGLGLTGLIIWAELKLKRIAGPWMVTERHRFVSLADFFRLSAETEVDHEYTVAWVDCAARGKRLGRGLFMCGNHTDSMPEKHLPVPARGFSVPVTPPFSLINRWSLRSFNWLYYHSQGSQARHTITHYEPYFYPLDRILHWNRIYGPKGFLQYQCVVSPDSAESAIAEIMQRIASHGSGSFLAVLKQFGKQVSPGMMSFPRRGTTLALDFPIGDRSVFRLLDALDTIVAQAGGAVYPAKDARMSGKRFRQYFPAWQAFSQYIDPRFSSAFWRRVME